MPISISDKPCYVNLILAPQHTNENPRVQKYPPVWLTYEGLSEVDMGIATCMGGAMLYGAHEATP